MLEDYRDVRPENEGRLRALLAAGRIEVGPSYVLPDELLVGGESLVRNLLIGRAVCERFGARAVAGRLPARQLRAPAADAADPGRLRDPQLDLLPRASATSWTRSASCSAGARPTGARCSPSSSCRLQQLRARSPARTTREARSRAIVEQFGRRARARRRRHELLLCTGADHLPVSRSCRAMRRARATSARHRVSDRPLRGLRRRGQPGRRRCRRWTGSCSAAGCRTCCEASTLPGCT